MKLPSHIHWPFRTGADGWHACTEAFRHRGLELPTVPLELAQVLRDGLREEKSGSFSTVGWRCASRWSGRIEDWVSHPDPIRASIRLCPGMSGWMAEICLATPQLGMFMRHRLKAAADERGANLAVQSAYRSAGELMARIHEMVDTGAWVEGQRLLLLDDDLDLPRWGWVHRSAGALEGIEPAIRIMWASQVMYADVMAILDLPVVPESDLVHLS